MLHMVCDLTIAADNAIFGQTGPKVGSIPLNPYNRDLRQLITCKFSKRRNADFVKHAFGVLFSPLMHALDKFWFNRTIQLPIGIFYVKVEHTSRSLEEHKGMNSSLHK